MLATVLAQVAPQTAKILMAHQANKAQEQTVILLAMLNESFIEMKSKQERTIECVTLISGKCDLIMQQRTI